MSSIEELNFPLTYQAKYQAAWADNLQTGSVSMRTLVRALTGMQKEALIYYAPSGAVWRMVSDEGPYLNGTDLAPFPLAYYTAGMAFSFVAEFLKLAEKEGIRIDDVELAQDNFYTMEGSALRGDMIGGCLPAELTLKLKSEAEPARLKNLMLAAAKQSPPQAYNRDVLKNIFSLTHNGEQIEPPISPSDMPKADPLAALESAHPLDEQPRDDLVIKLESAETVFNQDGGAGSSLKSEQKRTLHVRGVVTRRDDGLLQAKIQLFKPIGSTFQMLCDYQMGETPKAVAPPPLAFLSAGVGFCFMTQTGRYATIMKLDLEAYRIVQDNAFMFEDDRAIALPMDTHLFVELNDDQSTAGRILQMSEQTCFLHAAMRSECPSRLRLDLNGEITEIS